MAKSIAHKETLISTLSYETCKKYLILADSSKFYKNFSKKRSRLSSCFERLEQEKEIKFNSEEEKVEQVPYSTYFNDFKFVKVNMDIKSHASILNINLKVSESVKINELLKMAINQLNAQLKEFNLQLKTDSSYLLKPSKKSGKPNSDLPCLSNDVSVFETCLNNFSLIYKEEDLINIAKLKELKPGFCNRCLIF